MYIIEKNLTSKFYAIMLTHHSGLKFIWKGYFSHSKGNTTSGVHRFRGFRGSRYDLWILSLLSAHICQFSSNLVCEDFRLHPHAHLTHFSTPACVRLCEISHIRTSCNANSKVCLDYSTAVAFSMIYATWVRHVRTYKKSRCQKLSLTLLMSWCPLARLNLMLDLI